MNRAIASHETATERPHALPRQAMWFFLVAPPALAFLFDPNCLMEPGHVARAMLTMWTYTVLVGVAVHFSFEWLAPRLESAPLIARVPAHLLLCTLVVGLITVPLLPLVLFVYPEASGMQAGILFRGVLVSWVYLGVASFIAHLQRLAVRERLRAHGERTAALEARLTVLQAQMQPHFLFNSLNVCAGLVHEDADAAEATLDQLSGFLRYALESTEQRLVTVGDELDAVVAYLGVQQQRFGDRLEFEIQADEDARARRLPPMLLQPLVENAILHGLREREAGGRVRVQARVASTGELEVDIEDDGCGPGGSHHRGTGTGLRNVEERIALVFGDGASLSTGPSQTLGGFACRLRLPKVLR